MLLGILGFLGVIAFAAMSLISLFKKNGKLKRNSLITGLCFVMFITGIIISDDPIETVKGEQGAEEKNSSEQEEDLKNDKTLNETKKNINDDVSDENQINDEEEREFTVGKSNKDFKDLTKSKPSKVRNDVTDSWKLTRVSEAVDINEYLLSYASDYFNEDDNVHIIINFTYGTTTIINDFGSYLSARVHEYVDKEEHDAKQLGKGLLLGEFNIYKDNGDIVDVEEIIKSEENM